MAHATALGHRLGSAGQLPSGLTIGPYHRALLHDGRARGLMEAILWHGGEAEAAKAAVIAMDKPDRTALVAFLKSL